MILVDGQFDGIQLQFTNDTVGINEVSKDEHVLENKQLIRVLK